MKNLAIIPARSGSKGLKDKNIKLLNGKPLMYYSIDAALRSGLFDEVMVSTDSAGYADTARESGAAVPFLRSPENSDDKAGSWDAVKEVLDNYKKTGKEFDTVCLLQPTSPMRTDTDIIEAYRLFEERSSVAVVSVCVADHFSLCNKLPDDGCLDGFLECKGSVRRQDQQTVYRINGAVYIVSVKELMKDSNLFRKGSYAYIMPAERSIDIDSELDLKFAEFLMRENTH